MPQWLSKRIPLEAKCRGNLSKKTQGNMAHTKDFPSGPRMTNWCGHGAHLLLQATWYGATSTYNYVVQFFHREHRVRSEATNWNTMFKFWESGWNNCSTASAIPRIASITCERQQNARKNKRDTIATVLKNRLGIKMRNSSQSFYVLNTSSRMEACVLA